MEKAVKLIASNRNAHYNYFLSDFLEVGITLTGTEIKSLRAHGASLLDSYVSFINGEAVILGMNIAPYDKGNIFNHDPLRNRVLLLHKAQIRKYQGFLQEKGYTIVATKVYLKNGKAKMEIALGKGKKNYDKREVTKDRDTKREMQKALKERNE